MHNSGLAFNMILQKIRYTPASSTHEEGKQKGIAKIIRGYSGLIPLKFRKLRKNEIENLRKNNLQNLNTATKIIETNAIKNR